MSDVLSYKSKAEICTFVEYDERIRLPSIEWRLIAKRCVSLGHRRDPKDIPSINYFSSDSFHIAVGKRSLAESLDVVFSPGDPLLVWRAVPDGLIEVIVKRYIASCNGPLTIRGVAITGLNITDVWINAYYTSFPCYECSSTECRESQCLVFHLTPRGRSQNTLSLKYTYRIKSELERVKDQRVEVVVGTTQCGGVGQGSKESAKNPKSSEGIALYFDYLDYTGVLDLMNSTHVALECCTRRWGLCDLWLQLLYPSLEALVDERFVEWEFIQRLRFIRLEVLLFDADGDPVWIPCLFQLPDCQAIDVTYCIQDEADGVDWSAHAFDVMGEIMRAYENAGDVSGFVRSFEFILRLRVLTWNHNEPVPTHSNVPDEWLSGRFDVYETNNKATGMPLSVLVNTKESVEVNVFGDEERHFLFRKERYVGPSNNDS